MICRVWRGRTSAENASAYERLLRETVFPGIAGRHIDGYHGIQLLRRTVGDDVEFMTVMRFDSLDAVRSFAGADHETAVVPPAARALLHQFDTRAAHYDVVAE